MRKTEVELGHALKDCGSPIQEFEPSPVLVGALEAMQKFTEATQDMDPFGNTGDHIQGPLFDIQAYSWAECSCDTWYDDPGYWVKEKCTCGYIPQTHNFWWQGDESVPEFKVCWYKYLGRGMSVDREPTNAEVGYVLTKVVEFLIKET